MGGVANLVFSGPLLAAIPVAAAAGAVSFLSPCCLPLVPGYVSYITGMSGVDLQRRVAGRRIAVGAAASPGAARGPDVAAETARRVRGEPDAARLDAATARTAAARAAGGDTAAVSTAPRVAGAADATTDAATGAAPGRDLRRRLSRPARSRALAGAALFVLGFAALFASYGALFGGLGATLSAHQRGLAQVLGALTIALGLLFMGIFERFSLAGRTIRPSFRPRAGLAGAPLLGVLFGLGWTPCIGPTLTAVMTMSITAGTAARGAFLAFVYALGLGIPFLVAAVALQRGLRAFAFARRHARLITQVGGVMLVAVGITQVTGVWTDVVGSLQHWISGYALPL